MKYKNILQIDDDHDDCEFFEQALRSISDAAYTAIHKPTEALRKLASGEIKPDIIFMDINMPYLSGTELLTEFKKREIIKDIPVIFLSTSDLYADKTEALGVNTYIVKPYTFEELKNLLLKIL